MKKLLLALIRLYQLTLSPLLGPSCRFEPSCSRYAAGCIELHGAARGSLLALRRLLRCHPFHRGGYDPPPPALPRPARSVPVPAKTRLESSCNTDCRARPSARWRARAKSYRSAR